MRATVEFVQQSFTRFNSLCFEGTLRPIPIKLANARTFLGKVTYTGKRNLFGKIVSYGNVTLRISTAFDLPENELEDVVIHEMIHYCILLRRLKDTSAHGIIFRKMMAEINARYGRHITVSHRFEKGAVPPAEEKIRENYLCVTRFQDGNWGVTVCAKTRIFEIHRKLPRYYRLRSLDWYWSIDPFFNRYPRSKTPKIYKITKEELDAHLPSAQPMRCDGHTFGPASN